jgi:hypothetical protein
MKLQNKEHICPNCKGLLEVVGVNREYFQESGVKIIQSFECSDKNCDYIHIDFEGSK